MFIFESKGHGLRVLVGSALAGFFVALIPNASGAFTDADKATRETFYLGLLLTGILCWVWGRALKRRSGWSHSVNYLPVEWIGLVLIGLNVFATGLHFWEKYATRTAPGPVVAPIGGALLTSMKILNPLRNCWG